MPLQCTRKHLDQCVPRNHERQDLIQRFVSEQKGCGADSDSQGGLCTQGWKQDGEPGPISAQAPTVRSKQTKTGRKPTSCATTPDSRAGDSSSLRTHLVSMLQRAVPLVRSCSSRVAGCPRVLLGRSGEDLVLLPLASRGASGEGPEPLPADGQGSACHLQYWSSARSFPSLAGKAGRVGCKPCPWNLLSQLGPRMSTTPDREMERHRKKPGWKTSSQAGLQEAESQ